MFMPPFRPHEPDSSDLPLLSMASSIMYSWFPRSRTEPSCRSIVRMAISTQSFEFGPLSTRSPMNV
ncbi:hypothetical protein D3C87_1741830 [compost metagenome]